MLLLVDIGNTNIKYKLGSILAQTIQSQNFEVIENLFIQNTISQCYISNVNQNLSIQLKQLIAKYPNCKFQQAKSTRNFNTLTNAYQENYQKLGIDRWLAIIYCTSITHKNFMIVQAGSAITIDFVNAKQQHLGGIILPGMDYINDFYANKINLNSIHSDDNNYFATSSNQAINSGKYHLFKSLFQDAQNQFKHKIKDEYQIFISGGNAQTIQKFFFDNNKNCILIEYLVLKGLSIYFN